MATNPEAQEKLRAEINQFDLVITEQSLNKMKYLKACLKESQRMFPLFIGNSRIIKEDIVLKGYHIPKYTSVFWGSDSVSYDEKNFKNPEK